MQFRIRTALMSPTDIIIVADQKHKAQKREPKQQKTQNTGRNDSLRGKYLYIFRVKRGDLKRSFLSEENRLF